ncbi:stage III sporulation protein AG [Paenibacillus algorifonticola]|uniref:Stage III sporulation protein AG n=1 Tax=Paenibacillus algorifonticola TaxID=684063 RepID=A0A1I2ELH4_9BACL|nr:stage III sporulation protein AG [Paenibacillus algorifonticola]SFE93221.1 stage III sporulation protein AG [Paenibacillus algorifonticola]
MAKWLEKLEAMAGGGPGGPKRVQMLRLLLIIGCIGALLMLINSFLTYNEVEPSVQGQGQNLQPVDDTAWTSPGSQEGAAFEAVEQPLEARLKEILEKIVGVGDVDVLVTIDSTEEIVVERNEKETQSVTDENDKNGGKRHITTINKDGEVVLVEVSGDQKPIIKKTINPRIRGVLIVAKGAENVTVRRLIIDAVEKGVNVAASRISVAPRKQ